jgi:hypothetical protein
MNFCMYNNTIQICAKTIIQKFLRCFSDKDRNNKTLHIVIIFGGLVLGIGFVTLWVCIRSYSGTKSPVNYLLYFLRPMCIIMWEEKEMCLFQLECVFILIICQNHLNTVLHIKGITWSRLIHHISNWHTHTHFEITYITSTTGDF